MVLAEVSFKIYVVLLYFSWKSLVILKSSLLVVTLLVACVILDDAVQLGLKHADCFDWVLSNIFGKVWTKLSEIVQIDVETCVLLSDQTLD